MVTFKRCLHMKRDCFKSCFLSFVLFLSIGSTFAQQGIGTNKPNKSSVLDLSSNTKGLLMPRVSLTSTTNFTPITGIPSNETHTANSTMVYNIATSGSDNTAVKPGYYYWDQSSRLVTGKWVRLTSNNDTDEVPLNGDVTGKLGDNKVTKIQNVPVLNTLPNNGQVLQYNGSNWLPTTLPLPTVTAANNGLNLNNSTIQLGGNLTKSTTITNTANYNLILETTSTGSTGKLMITGLDKTKVQETINTGSVSGITQHVLAVDANNVVRALKATMPKFFYMPSIIVPTTNSQFVAINTSAGESFNDANRTGILNLYERYKVQFGTTGTVLQPSSPNAPTLPVLPASELHYYVTWYDVNVFESVRLDANGKMTYVVKLGADVTLGSFMNIIFAVKEN